MDDSIGNEGNGQSVGFLWIVASSVDNFHDDQHVHKQNYTVSTPTVYMMVGLTLIM